MLSDDFICHVQGYPKELHKIHWGIVQTKQRTIFSIYWPGINNDIESIVISCTQYQDHLPSNSKMPMLPKPKLTQLFQETVANFWCHGGRQYLVWVDCYSDWFIIVLMGKDTSTYKSPLVSTQGSIQPNHSPWHLITAKKITKTLDIDAVYLQSKHKDGTVLFNILKETAPSLYHCFITSKTDTIFII